jgi:hypothetical protein
VYRGADERTVAGGNFQSFLAGTTLKPACTLRL